MTPTVELLSYVADLYDACIHMVPTELTE